MQRWINGITLCFVVVFSSLITQAATAQVTCIDSDYGETYNERGIIHAGDYAAKDYCEGDYLIEWICNPDQQNPQHNSAGDLAVGSRTRLSEIILQSFGHELTLENTSTTNATAEFRWMEVNYVLQVGEEKDLGNSGLLVTLESIAVNTANIHTKNRYYTNVNYACPNGCSNGACMTTTNPRQFAVRGRLIDQQSGRPLAGVTIYTDSINGRSVNPITTDTSGYFTYTYSTQPVLMHVVPSCNDQFLLTFRKLATGEYETSVPSYESNDSCGTSFPAMIKQSQNGILDVGEIRIRPARTIELYTDEPASFEIWFRKNASCSQSTFGGGGNSNVRNRHTLSITMIPGYESQISLTKSNGKTVTSQWSMTQPTTSCEATTVGYVNGQFSFGVCGDNMCAPGEDQTCARDCIQQNICKDTDGDRNYSKKGTASQGSKQFTDYCQDSSYLMEYDCGEAAGISAQDGCGHNGLGGCSYKCPNGCSNGACIIAPQQPTCTDSDGGKDPFIKGTVIYRAPGIYDVDDDTCVNANRLGEQFCSNGVATTEMFTCAAGCSNGACLPENPTTGFRNATWECYDGVRSAEGGPTSCKSPETWKKYAEDSCRNHCYSDGSKCGVNSFSVFNECNGGNQEGTLEIKRIFLTVAPKSQWSASTTKDQYANVTEKRTDPSFRLWIDVRLPDGSRPQGNENLVVRQYLSENPADMTGGGSIAQYRYDGDGELYYGYGIGILAESMPKIQYLRVVAEYNGQKIHREAILTFNLPTPSVCDGCAIPTNPTVPPIRPPQGDWLYDTGRGNERVHKMTYAQYTSEGIFTPSKNMTVTAIKPDVYYCNGICKMNIEISEESSNRLLASSSQQGSSINAFTGQLSNSITLKKGAKYRIKLQTSTTMSVGIFTAGKSMPNANGYGTFMIQSAASNSSDHLDRGTIGFRLLEKNSSPPFPPVEPPLPPIGPPAGYEDDVQTNDGRNWFSDVTNDTEIGRAANALADLGVIGGYPDGEFKSDKLVNKAETAKFMLLSIGADVPNEIGNGGFWDVIADEWYAKYVVAATSRDILTGNPDGSFRPAKNVNTAEFLAMLVRAFGTIGTNSVKRFSDVPVDAWFAPYADIASSLQLFPDRGNLLMPNRQLTRGEVALALFRTIQQSER